MTKPIRLIAGLLVLACLFLGSCVELDGQRISLFYDAAKDEMRVLIFYDGIHESKSQSDDKGAVAIPRFVKAGDIMVMDWIGYVKLGEMRERAAAPEPKPAAGEAPTPAARAMLLATVASIKTQGIGRYRDSDGHIGAAQLVVISDAGKLVAKINAAVSESILTSDDEPGSVTARTLQLCKAAAKANHQWLKLDGHSLSMTFPVNGREWAAAKATFFLGLIDKLSDTAKKDNVEDRASVRRNLLSLASAVVSYDESGGQVRFRLGDPAAPSTVRVQLRNEYEPSLEPVVIKEVPAELDPAMADFLLNAKASPGLAEIAKWGPPEEAARALINTAYGNGPGAAKAKEQLTAWATDWNLHQGVPIAPESKEPAPAEAWRKWLREMAAFPAPATQSPAGATPRPVPAK
jgi:hypothetical protein